MKRFRPAPLPCGPPAKGRNPAEKPRPPCDAPAEPSSCARSRSAAARVGAPEASAHPAQICRRSRPYREHQEQRDEGTKNETEILPDGQELQAIEPFGRDADRIRKPLVHSLPDQIMQFDPQPRRPDISGGRHLDMIARAKYERSKDATDRLSEACARILSRGGWIGKATAPGRPPSQRMGGEAMNKIDG